MQEAARAAATSVTACQEAEYHGQEDDPTPEAKEEEAQGGSS